MSTRYPGGFINRSAPVIVGPVDGEGGSAPGVWTLEQASYYTKQGTWPLPLKAGYIYLAGDGSSGQLGQNNTVYRSSPVQVGTSNNWRMLSSAGATCKAIALDGTMWAWGNGIFGGLGTGNVISRSSPVQIGSLTNWNSLSLSNQSNNSGFAIKTDGTLWSWGSNNQGQLGQGNVVYTSSPVQIGSLTTWSAVSAMQTSAAAIKTDGTIWTWGYNGYGELGQNNITSYSSPVQVGALTTWLKIGTGYNCVLAISSSGSLWAWGNNLDGQLGDGTVIRRSSPVQIGALTTWSKIAGGNKHSMAIKTDGTLWTWGENNYGQLGQNTVYVSRSSPVQVGALTTWLSVAGGYNYTSNGLLTTGATFSWGRNNRGQLGQGDKVYRSSPTQIGSLSWKKTYMLRAGFGGIL